LEQGKNTKELLSVPGTEKPFDPKLPKIAARALPTVTENRPLLPKKVCQTSPEKN